MKITYNTLPQDQTCTLVGKTGMLSHCAKLQSVSFDVVYVPFFKLKKFCNQDQSQNAVVYEEVQFQVKY
jgi:hypothetical protein